MSENYYVNTNTVSSTEIKAFGENIRLGSDLLKPSYLCELGNEHESFLVSCKKFDRTERRCP